VFDIIHARCNCEDYEDIPVMFIFGATAPSGPGPPRSRGF
jgi:hypothetical protein